MLQLVLLARHISSSVTCSSPAPEAACRRGTLLYTAPCDNSLMQTTLFLRCWCAVLSLLPPGTRG
jgi:hypothetical protein